LPLNFENRVAVTALAAGALGVLATIILLFAGDYSVETRWTVTVFVVSAWLMAAFSAREQVLRPLQTLSNLVEALREGDFSLRGRAVQSDDALAEVIREVNALSKQLREERALSTEASALLRKVMTEIDVAIFAFDGDQRLRLINRGGERLLGNTSERLLAHTAEELGLRDCLEGEPARILQHTFPSGSGPWGLRRSTFREGGRPHELVVISDFRQALRDEERRAWQRLVRVMGHEINNSLAPIQSLVGTLERVLHNRAQTSDWHQDMERGLRVIGSRAESLSRFMQEYSRLARLPAPNLQPVNIKQLVHRVASLDSRLQITIEEGPDLTVSADPDQLEQALINIIRNAIDAALSVPSGAVSLRWRANAGYLEVIITDNGPGLASTTNLFVPFFTTKQGGSGIGLVLARQIMEGHGGSVSLSNREGARGCIARLRLPDNQLGTHASP
jgi:two-component system, NtrC family, nitrogen regulation sensor histidine kinase NtrY